MKSKGIEISDSINNVISVTLPDILKEIHNGNSFHWSILDLYASGNLGEGKSIVAFSDTIYKSEKGFFINWDDLNLLSVKFWEIIDIVIIGCKDENLLRKYENDKKMYEACDIFIVFFDSCFWEVFSKDEDLIERLAKRFNEIKFLDLDTVNY